MYLTSNCLQCFDAVGWVAYCPADATATVSCFSKIHTFLVLAHPGNPGQGAFKLLLLLC